VVPSAYRPFTSNRPCLRFAVAGEVRRVGCRRSKRKTLRECRLRSQLFFSGRGLLPDWQRLPQELAGYEAFFSSGWTGKERPTWKARGEGLLSFPLRGLQYRGSSNREQVLRDGKRGKSVELLCAGRPAAGCSPEGSGGLRAEGWYPEVL